MKAFLVDGGVARMGPGQIVGLSQEQFELRGARVELVKKLEGKYLIARAVESIEFKVGEIIGLDDLPRNLTDILKPLDKPETPVEQIAVEKSRERAVVKAREKAAATTKKK
jgi:hypothetical protein